MSEISSNEKSKNKFILFFGYCINKLWLLLASAIVLAALIHILLGLFLPEIDRYRSEIVEWIENHYQLKVDVNQISAKWSVHGPVLQLSGLKVKTSDNSDDALEVGKVAIYFDIITSVWNWRISTEEIVVDKANFVFYVNQSLGVKLQVNKHGSSTNDIDIDSVSAQVFDILFGQRRLLLTNSDLRFVTLSGKHFDYHIESFNILKFNEIHQLSGQLINEYGGAIELITEIYGDPSLPNSFSEIYLKGDGVELARLPLPKDAGFELPTTGNLFSQVWGTWKNDRWESVVAKVELNDVHWSKEQNIENNKSKFTAHLSWQQDESSTGYLVAHDITVNERTKETVMSSLSEFYLKYASQSEQSATWTIALKDFQLKELVSYFAGVVDHEWPMSPFLEGASFELLVNDFYMEIPKRMGLWRLPEYSMIFSNLSYNDWDSYPKVNGLFGKAYWKKSVGIVDFQLKDSTIELSQIFRHAIDVEKMSSLFTWSNDEIYRKTVVENQSISGRSDRMVKKNLNVKLLNATLLNNDLEIRAQAEWFTQDKQPIFSLYSELTNVNAEKKSRYLPTGIMTKSLVSYLDGSVKSGHFPLIKMAIRGPMPLFPFAKQDGYFAALGFLENASYQYLPDWPTATQLSSKLLFIGNSMDITASHAASLANKINYARATTADFSMNNPILDLILNVDSYNNSGQKFLNETPLNGIASSISDLDFKGKINTEVRLQVGLNASSNDKPKVQGKIILTPNVSQISAPFMRIDNIDGVIEFDEKSILSSDLVVKYKGNYFDINLVGNRQKEEPELTLTASGILNNEGVSNFLNDEWAQLIEGESLVKATIEFGPKKNNSAVLVDISSDMKGFNLKLPGLLEKKKDIKKNLSLKLDFSDVLNGRVLWNGISASWYSPLDSNNFPPLDSAISAKEEKANLEVARQSELVDVQSIATYPINYGVSATIGYSTESGIENGLLIKDGDSVEIPPGITVKGRLASVDINEWIYFINRYIRKTENKLETENLEDEILVNSIAIDVGEIRSSFVILNDSNINVSKAVGDDWRLMLNGSEGKIDLRLNSYKPWTINLEGININLNESVLSESENKNRKFMPMDMVDIDLVCDSCVIQGKNYGKIQAEIRKNTGRVNFLATLSNGKKHSVSLKGVWKNDSDLTHLGLNVAEKENDENNASTRTLLEFDLKTNNAGDILKKWGIDAAIKDSSGRLVSTLTWGGAPWEFDYKNADARIRLNLDKGYLSEISDGSGRIFSLFNFQSLIRKLTFDFKDVYKKGFFYDSIKGSFVLKQGILSTDNIKIKGNVADVKLSGSTNLINETIDQYAIITPHLTSSLPVLAAWAVEPTTGLIVYILNKIMEPAVEVVTRIDYRVHGSFEQVNVDQVSSRKKKVKVEYESVQETRTIDTEEKRPIDGDEILKKENGNESNQSKRNKNKELEYNAGGSQNFTKELVKDES